MADHHDERAARFLELLGAGFDKTAADPLPLELGQHRHRAEPGSDDFPDVNGAVENVADQAIAEHGDQRQLRRTVGSEGVDNRAFLLLAERAPVNLADGGQVGGLLAANHDHGTSRIVTR